MIRVKTVGNLHIFRGCGRLNGFLIIEENQVQQFLELLGDYLV